MSPAAKPSGDEISPGLMRWCASLALAALMAGTLMNIVSGDHPCAPGEARFNAVSVGKGVSIATLLGAVVLGVLQQMGRLPFPPRKAAYAFLALAGTTTVLSLGLGIYLDQANDPVCSPF